MKLAELISSKGQSLLELVIAIGIFVITVSSLSFFIIDSYASGRLSYELTKANFLAEEGIEAVASVRNNQWEDLVSGAYGLSIIDNKWVLTEEDEDLSDYLRNGKRIIQIEDVDENRKKIISSVFWKFSEVRPEKVQLITYLSNWQKISFEMEKKRPTRYLDSPPRRTIDPELAFDENNGETFAKTPYSFTKDPSIIFFDWENFDIPYTELTLNYRYHAEEAIGKNPDKYAVAYSIQGCEEENFIDLIPLTSESISDTTVSINLLPDQDLSLLCLKIYTIRNAPPDSASIYTRDIWVEGKP